MPQNKFISKADISGQSVFNLSELKVYLKIDESNTSEDGLINSLLKSAVEYVENYCNIALRACEVSSVFDDFEIDEGEIVLSLVPVTAIKTVSFLSKAGVVTSAEYNSVGEDLQELTALNYMEDKIKVVYDIGYTNDTIPKLAVTAVYKIVAGWYENRETTGDITADVRRMLKQISFATWI